MPLHPRWYWLPAFLFSLLGHAAAFWLADQYVAMPGPQHEAERVITISMVQVATQQPVAAPVGSATHKKPPLPRRKPRLRHKRQHQRPVVKHATVSPAAASVTRQGSPPVSAAPRPAKQPASVPVAVTKAAAMPPSHAADERKHYIERLMAHIEAFKRYPRRARRRHQEGDVEVSLRLNSDGSVASMTAHGGAPGLRKASLRAVADACPLPPPPAYLAAPVDIRFIMRFRLH